MQLGARGPLTPTALGRLVALSSGEITAALDRLEEGGWIERQQHPTDRRSKLVSLSRAGTLRAENAYRPMVGDLEVLAAELPPEVRWALARFLARASAITERHAELLLGAPVPVERPGAVSGMWGYNTSRAAGYIRTFEPPTTGFTWAKAR